MSFWFMAIKWEGIPLLIPNWTVNKKAFNLYSFFGFATERLLHIYCNSTGSKNSSCCCCCSCPCCCCCCCGAFLWKLKNHNARANGFPTPIPPSLSLALSTCAAAAILQPHVLRQHGTMTPRVPLPHGTCMSRCEEFCFCIFYTHTHTHFWKGVANGAHTVATPVAVIKCCRYCCYCCCWSATCCSCQHMQLCLPFYEWKSDARDNH